MSEQINNEQGIEQEERKKISLQEAIKKKLAEKKQAQTTFNAQGKQKAGNQKVKSQQTKKPNNQRKRMGV